ncbi:MAG: hypothetical protein ACE5DI_05520 [Candidatus Micrarchaeia archaeon]
MVVKSFSLSEEVYRKFAVFCKARGISMSKQVEFFMESVLEKEPAASETYLKRLNRLRKERFIAVENFSSRYGLD